MNVKTMWAISLSVAAVAARAVEPWTVDSSVPEHVAEYAPPILANGDIGMLVDYRNCQFQDVPSYTNLRSVAGEYFPATCRQGRRTVGDKLVTWGRVEEEVWVGGHDEKPVRWSQRLDVFRGASVCENAYPGDVRVDSTAFVAQHPSPCPTLGQRGSVFAVEKRFSGPVEKYVFKWVYRRPGLSGLPPIGSPYTISPSGIVWSADRPEKKVSGGLAGKPAYIDRTLRGQIALRCSEPSAELSCEGDTLRVTLVRPRGAIAFFVLFSDSQDRPAERLETERLVDRGYAALKEAHEAAWKVYWGDFYVNLPDKLLERTYYTALYNLKCWSTRWTVPIGILPTHWEGKFFGFGFNAAAFAGAGKLEEARKIGRFWASIHRVGKARAGSTAPGRDLESGVRYSWQTLEDGREGASNGRWLDHFMHLGTISADCWNAYRYTQDREFLREVYPVLRDAAQYFRAWLVQELRDGRTVIGPVCDLERLPCPARNACLTTCAAICSFEKAAVAAQILDADARWIPEWRRLAAELRRDLPTRDGRFLAAEGCDETSVGTIAGLFPFDAVPRTDAALRASVAFFERHGVRAGNPYKIGTRVCTWYAAWLADDYARLLDGEGAYRNLVLANGSVGFFNEIYEINEPVYKSVPWCQAPQATLIQCVHDMLVQEVDGEIRVAPAVPRSWTDYSFRLRAPGNRVVEARCAKGRLTYDIR